MVLEQGVLDQEAVALVLEPLPVDFFAARGRRVGVTLPAVDRLGVRREAPHREPRREQAALGGVSGVERLGHRAEVRLETAGLGRRQAQGVGELLVAGAQQVAGGGRGAVDPDRRGRVPALDVRGWSYERSDSRLHFDADDERDEQALARGPHLLRLRQDGRKHGHGGMTAHHAVRVVEVERMAGGAVEQRGDARRAVEVRAHNGARAGLMRRAPRAGSRTAVRGCRRARSRTSRARTGRRRCGRTAACRRGPRCRSGSRGGWRVSWRSLLNCWRRMRARRPRSQGRNPRH